LTAACHPPAPQDHTPATPEPPFTDALLNLLGHPNIRSKEDTIRRYDHEVQTATALKPLVGVADHGPGDATVLVPLDTINPLRPAKAKGVALSNGICPQYGAQDPYAMAWAAIDEAFRNIVATGTDPDQVAILDNFCWGNPNLPDRLGALVRCSQGCYDAAVAYGAPFISGKDSLNNEYTGADGQKHAIPGTLLISAMGIVPDVNKTVSMAAKKAGNFLFAIGDTRAELGASHYGLIGGHYNAQQNQVPQPVKNAPARFRAIHQAIQQGLIQACHDPSEGGFAVAIAEMCLAGRIGAEISLGYAPAKPYMTDKVLFFAESLSRFIVEVRPEDVDALTELLGDIPHACIGVLGGEKLQMKGRFDKILLDLPITDIEQAWRGHLNAGQHITPQRPTPTSNTPTMLRKTPKVLILHANGTNRDRDAALACQLAGGQPEIVHMNQILNGDRHLSDYNMLVIPGGFSYGDDLGAGVLWAANIAHVLGEDMHTFVADGRPVLGICNGFQVLVKAGILPGHTWTPHVDDRPHRLVTLTYNESARFECRWVYLQPNSNSRSLFTQDLTDPILCPIAHGEGRLAVQDDDTAQALDTDGLIALTYTEADGSSASYPANPNGSTLDIAGICNPAGNVLGLMPHPENHIFSWQHPRRHHGEHGLSGLPLFINGIRHA
ncbi:MAG TPA: phosphoribosylformylglycinamidine synthase I, partial [Anaerolineae bacterium]|nr:phosphoribosylformylglycinamidine synthase I [Anaerolineae bacterium]